MTREARLEFLRDLVKLYMIDETLTPPEAVAAITRDLQQLVAQGFRVAAREDEERSEP